MSQGATHESVLAKATRRLEAARREVEAWQDFIDRLRSLDDAPVVPATIPNGATALLDVSALNGSEVRQKPARGSSAAVMETDRRVSDVLREHGRPMKVGSLVRALAEQGFPVGGKDPSNTLSARLARSELFVNIKDNGWWLRDAPIPSDEIGAAGPQSEPAAPNEQSSYSEGAHSDPVR